MKNPIIHPPESTPSDPGPGPEAAGFWRNLWRAPILEGRAKNQIANLQYKILLGLFLVSLLTTILFLLSWSDRPLSGFVGALMGTLAFALTLFWLRRGHVEHVSWILVSELYVVFIASCLISTSGLTNALLLALVIIMAGLLLRPYSVVAITIIAILTLLVMQAIVPAFAIYQADLVSTLLILGVAGLLLTVASHTLEQSFAEVDQSTQDILQANRELQALSATLEQRVAERTSQLQISAEVGRTAATSLDQAQLLREVVNLIAEQFKFYYVAVFLVNETGARAVLREATGLAGQILKERGLALEVGGQSIIGYVTAQRKSRIELDVGLNAVRFANPLLPETRSEIALPLIVGDQVLGVLDIQAAQAAAFDESYAAVLQSMANQIAVALNNAWHFKQTEQQVTVQANLNQLSRSLFSATEAGTLYRILADQIGQVVPHDYLSLTLTQNANLLLREYELRAKVDPVLVEGPLRALDTSLCGRAFNSRHIALSLDLAQDAPKLADLADLEQRGFQSAASLPLMLGDRVLGTLNFASRKPAAFLARNLTLFNQIAGQVAAALESVRLAQAQQHTLQELETLTQQLTKQSWATTIRQSPGQSESRQYARSGLETDRSITLPEVDLALETKQPVAWSKTSDQPAQSPYQATLAAPIMLRGEVLGALQAGEMGHPRTWNEEDITFIKAVADQVALALDNARLIEQTERRAQREQIITEISSKLFVANDLPEILRIATEELGQALHLARVETKIDSEYLQTDPAHATAHPNHG